MNQNVYFGADAIVFFAIPFIFPQQSGFLDKLSFWELNLATTGGQGKSWKFHEFHGFFFLVIETHHQFISSFPIFPLRLCQLCSFDLLLDPTLQLAGFTQSWVISMAGTAG